MAFKVCKMDPEKPGRVAIALMSEYSPGKDTVYWSPRGLHDGRGGFNSFVLVADAERGQWRMADGKRVNLLSINGIGEIRWTVDPHSKHYGEGAEMHFRLMPWDETTVYVIERDGMFRTTDGQVLWFTHKWEAEKAAKTFGWPDGTIDALTVAQLLELQKRVDSGEV